MNKNIFKYQLNGKDRYADPLRLERRWQKIIEKVDIDSLFKNLVGPPFLQNVDENGIAHDENGNVIPQATPATIKLALANRREAEDGLTPLFYALFECSPIDPETGEGVLEQDIWAAYEAFVQFGEQVKKNTDMNLNSPQSSMPNSTSPITSDFADSTGIGPAPSPSMQSPS